MTTTLHDLLDAGHPDLPPAPRHPGGRHRSDRGSISGEHIAALFWLFLTLVVAFWLVLGSPGANTDRPAVDCSVESCESAPYPQPVPGAPPQAPHAGWPGASAGASR